VLPLIRETFETSAAADKPPSGKAAAGLLGSGGASFGLTRSPPPFDPQARRSPLRPLSGHSLVPSPTTVPLLRMRIGARAGTMTQWI